MPFPSGEGGSIASRSSEERSFSAILLSGIKLCVSALLFFAGATPAQDLASATPTTRDFLLFIDTNAEDPPIYNGLSAVPRPSLGDSVEFQIFMPDAAGLEAYAFQLAFQDTGRIFSEHFDILNAQTEARPLLPVPKDDELPEFRALHLDAPRGSDGPLRGTLLLTPWHVSYSGLIGVVKLLAKKDIPYDLPLVLDVNITVVSKTPPTRLFVMRARQEIGWRGTP